MNLALQFAPPKCENDLSWKHFHRYMHQTGRVDSGCSKAFRSPASRCYLTIHSTFQHKKKKTLFVFCVHGESLQHALYTPLSSEIIGVFFPGFHFSSSAGRAVSFEEALFGILSSWVRGLSNVWVNLSLLPVPQGFQTGLTCSVQIRTLLHFYRNRDQLWLVRKHRARSWTSASCHYHTR